MDHVNAKTSPLRVYCSALIMLVLFVLSTMQKDADVLNVRLRVGPLLWLFSHNVALTHNRFSSMIPVDSVSVRLDGRWILSHIKIKSVSRQTMDVLPVSFFSFSWL